MIEINKDAFYSSKDLSELLKKTPGTIRKLCRFGKIKDCKKVGREWVIPGNSIIEYLSIQKRRFFKK